MQMFQGGELLELEHYSTGIGLLGASLNIQDTKINSRIAIPTLNEILNYSIPDYFKYLIFTISSYYVIFC